MGRSAYLGGDPTRHPAIAGAVAGPRSGPSWHTEHKGALQFRTALQGSGTLVKLGVLDHEKGVPRGAIRGRIGNTPSAGTYLRFMRAVNEIPWDSYDRENIFCGNLTYHGIPRDGRAVRRDVKAFERRLDRAIGPRGKCWGMIWVKEFQKRGAWHLHFVLHIPQGWSIAIEGRSVYMVVRDAWLSVIGESDDLQAYLHGVECSTVENMHKVKAYVLKYMNKSARSGPKAYEKHQPKWFLGGGRWWGKVGRAVLAPAYESLLLHTYAEFWSVRRLIRSYIAHITHGRYVPPVWGNHSMTVLAHGGDRCFLGELIRWLTLQRAPVIFSL